MPNDKNNVDSIYSRLLDGESEEAIAQAFLDALNEAKDRYAAEKAAEEAQKAAEARAKAEHEKSKKRDMKGLILDFLYFIAHYYPAFGIKATDVDTLDEGVLDDLANFFTLVIDLEAMKPAKSRIDLTNIHSGVADLRELRDLIEELDKIEL